MISNPPDFVIGIVFLLAGAFATVVASSYPPLPGTIVGAGLFPLVTGIAMVLFGGILAFQAWRGSVQDEVVPVAVDGETEPETSPALFSRFSLGIVVIIALTIILMHPLGFVVTGILAAVSTIRLSGGSWLRALIFSPVATLVLFYTFIYAFGVPLPRGIIG